jgi:predicted SAM-dependent methyltransferase
MVASICAQPSGKMIMKQLRSRLAQILSNLGNRLESKPKPPPKLSRELIAETYLRGEGIEIGALHNPLKVPASANIRYVDRLGVAQLREQYPELNDKKLVEVDILDNGERLLTIPDSSQDFVIANHFVEHCEDPIGAVLAMLRVLKPGGILYLAIPDKRCCFDADRPVTSIDHLIRDHLEGPEWSRPQHFAEWVQLVNKVSDENEAQKQIAELTRKNYSIHFHAWTPFEMMEFFVALRKMTPFEIDLCFHHDGVEVIFILRNLERTA